MVLTQLYRVNDISRFAAWFPYHYGSHATIDGYAKNFGTEQAFPYHYGSHATERRWRMRFYHVSPFPYHYGSHATLIASKQNNLDLSFHTTMVLTQQEIIKSKFNKWISVSIPLWFSRNEANVRRVIEEFTRFHTTMVLTQQAVGFLKSL